MTAGHLISFASSAWGVAQVAAGVVWMVSVTCLYASGQTSVQVAHTSIKMTHFC